MEIWLKQDDIEIQLPVLPKGYDLTYPRNNTEENVSSFGSVNMIGNKGLATATLSSFWPRRKYKFLQCELSMKPKEFVKKINEMANAPVRYIVTGAGINMLMTIEDFSVSEEGASGDLNYTITLKQYRIPKIKAETKKGKSTNEKKKTALNKTSKKITVKETTRPTKKVNTKTYTVKKGDTLMTIAKRETGNSENYKAIANQNNISNPNKIYVGQKLVIKV